MLEALASCLTYYPVTFNDQMGRPMRKKRFVPPRASVPRATGWSGSGSEPGSSGSTSAPWWDHPEWTEDPKLFLDRTALAPTIDEWIGEHTVDEVLDLASAFRIPNAPVVNGANVTTFEHFRSRGTFVREPEGRCGEPASALPARRCPPASRASPPPDSASTPSKRPCSGARTDPRGQGPNAPAPCPSRACGCWT